MAEIETLTLKLKILDLESFGDLVEALGTWAEEVNLKANKSDAEQALFNAAVALDRNTT